MSATLVFDRHHHASPTVVGRDLSQALERMGFEIRRATSGRLEARLGSAVRAGLRLEDRGVTANIAVVGTPARSRVLGALSISETDPFTTPLSVIADQLVTALTVQQGLDEDTAGTLPDAVTKPVLVVPGSVGPLYTGVLSQHAVYEAVRGQLRVMEVPDVPEHGLTVVDSAIGAAQLSRQHLRDLLDLTVYVAGRGDTLPPGQQESLVDLTVALWTFDRGIHAGLHLGTLVARAANLVDAQRRIRAAMVARLVMVCRDCGFERVTNPDYRRLARRNQRIRSAIGAGTAALFPSATLLTVGGRLLGGKTFDPEFVCQRCQGLKAEEIRATICPQCGQLRKESILGPCPKAGCDFDLDGVAGTPRPLFTRARPVAAPSAAPAASPERGTAFPTLPDEPRPTAGAWARDPTGAAAYRWHDGTRWTAWVQ